MIALRDLSLRRGTTLLLEGADLTLHPGHKIGLVGANGSGKSSLFALLQGELEPDRGQCNRPAGWVVAHVAQEVPAGDMPAIDHVLAGDRELIELEAELERAEALGNGMRVAELHARLDAIDGYAARARAGRLLAGLGFQADAVGNPVSSFSGGWRMRLNLARALMCRSDLLLLDEPTNHLDLDAVIWLEQWLRGYRGTLILISHDREFLDAVVDQVVHLDQRRLELYSGGYSDFERERATRLASQQASFQAQQREIAHLHRFVERFRAKASKARQVQSRVKALQRMELIAAAHADSPFRFSFPSPQRMPDPVMRFDGVSGGYGGQAVLRGLRFGIGAGQRIGLLGPNGAGKSTLIKMFAGMIAPMTGDRIAAQDLVVGYFAQHQLEALRDEWSALDHLQRLDPGVGEQAGRNFLGGFGFHGDRVLEPVAPYSGGEKARLALALIVWGRPNLLLLDEPTNHLDLEMRHALTLALQDYQGALVLVSHDRHLLRTVCDDLWLVADGGVEPFDGDLEDYRQWLAERQGSGSAADAVSPARDTATQSRREVRRQEAENRNTRAARRRPLEQRLGRVETELDRVHTEKRSVEQLLSDPDLYSAAGSERLTALLRQQGELARELASLEQDWLALQEDLERL